MKPFLAALSSVLLIAPLFIFISFFTLNFEAMSGLYLRDIVVILILFLLFFSIYRMPYAMVRHPHATCKSLLSLNWIFLVIFSLPEFLFLTSLKPSTYYVSDSWAPSIFPEGKEAVLPLMVTTALLAILIWNVVVLNGFLKKEGDSSPTQFLTLPKNALWIGYAIVIVLHGLMLMAIVSAFRR